MSNISKPDIELVLDVRSYEKVVVISDFDESKDYPDNWICVSSSDEFDRLISGNFDLDDTLIASMLMLVDRVDVSPSMIRSIGSCRPRLVAFIPCNVEQEKSMRRILSSTYPWSEVWTVSSSLGKILMAKDIVGSSYDRCDVFDERPLAEA